MLIRFKNALEEFAQVYIAIKKRSHGRSPRQILTPN